jgi:hypothetical protein
MLSGTGFSSVYAYRRTLFLPYRNEHCEVTAGIPRCRYLALPASSQLPVHPMRGQAAFSGTRRRLRTLSQKASMSTLPVASPSTANLVIQPLKSVSAMLARLRSSIMYPRSAAFPFLPVLLQCIFLPSQRCLHDAAAEARQQISKTESEPATSKRQSFQLSRHEALAKLRDSEEPERDVDKSLTPFPFLPVLLQCIFLPSQRCQFIAKLLLDR